jgi:hypothetical protein
LQWIPVGLIQTRVGFGRSPVSLATWLHNITYVYTCTAFMYVTYTKR